MTKQVNPILSVDFKREFSTLTEEVTTVSRVCIDLKAIQGGLIKEIGANRVSMLLVIVSYMDASGRAFPSQEKIAELTGQGRATVQRNIEALCEAEFNGQKLMHKETVGTVRKKTVYTLNQAILSNTDDIEESLEKEAESFKPDAKKMNARDLAGYFLKVYEDSFKFQYNMTYNREIPMLKSKLVDKYDSETLKAIVDIGVGEYKNRWAKPSYPHPTVGMLTGWLGNEAVSIYHQRLEKEQKKAQKKQVSAEQDQTEDALMSFFN